MGVACAPAVDALTGKAAHAHLRSGPTCCMIMFTPRPCRLTTTRMPLPTAASASHVAAGWPTQHGVILVTMEGCRAPVIKVRAYTRCTISFAELRPSSSVVAKTEHPEPQNSPSSPPSPQNESSGQPTKRLHLSLKKQ